MALSKDIGDQLLGNSETMDLEQVAYRPSAFVASEPVLSARNSAYKSETPHSATNTHLNSLTVHFSATAPATYGSGSGPPLGHHPLPLPIERPSGLLPPGTGSSWGPMAIQAQYTASTQDPPQELAAFGQSYDSPSATPSRFPDHNSDPAVTGNVGSGLHTSHYAAEGPSSTFSPLASSPVPTQGTDEVEQSPLAQRPETLFPGQRTIQKWWIKFYEDREQWSDEVLPACLGRLDPPRAWHTEPAPRSLLQYDTGPYRDYNFLPIPDQHVTIKSYEIEAYFRSHRHFGYHDLWIRGLLGNVANPNIRRKNALNRQRDRQLRLPYNVRSWVLKHDESPKVLLQLLQKLSPRQLELNTTWNVTDKGIVQPGNPNHVLPLDYFLDDDSGNVHLPSAAVEKAMRKLRELQELAITAGLPKFSWEMLPKDLLPKVWSCRKKDKAKEKPNASDHGAKSGSNVAENMKDGPNISDEIPNPAEVIFSNSQNIGFDFDSNKAGNGYGMNGGLENIYNADGGQDVLSHNREQADVDDTFRDKKNPLFDDDTEQFCETTETTTSCNQQIVDCDDLETPNGGNEVVANSSCGIEDISRIATNENSNAEDGGDSADKDDSDSLFGSDVETNYGSDNDIDDNDLEVDIWKLDAFDVKIIEPHASLMSLPSTISERQLDFIASTGHTIDTNLFSILGLDLEPALAGIDLSQLQRSPEVLRQRNILRHLYRRSNTDLDGWLSPGLGSCVLSNAAGSIETSRSATSIDLGWRNNKSRPAVGPNKNLHNTMFTRQRQQAGSLSTTDREQRNFNRTNIDAQGLDDTQLGQKRRHNDTPSGSNNDNMNSSPKKRRLVADNEQHERENNGNEQLLKNTIPPPALLSPTESVSRHNLVDKLSSAPLRSVPPWPLGTQQVKSSASRHGLPNTVPITPNPILHSAAQAWKDNSVGVPGSVGHTVRAYNHSPYANVSSNVQGEKLEQKFAREFAAQPPIPKQITAVKYPPYTPPATQSQASFPHVPQAPAPSYLNSTFQFPASQHLNSPPMWNLNRQSSFSVPHAMGYLAQDQIGKSFPPPHSNTSLSMQVPPNSPVSLPGVSASAMRYGPGRTQTPPLTPPEYPLTPASEPPVGHVHPQTSSFKLQPAPPPVKSYEKSTAASQTNGSLDYNLNYNSDFGSATAIFQRNNYGSSSGRGSPAPIPFQINEHVPLAGWVLKRPGENLEISERGKDFLSVSLSHSLVQANATEPEEWWCHPATCENCWGLKPQRPSGPVQMSIKQNPNAAPVNASKGKWCYSPDCKLCNCEPFVGHFGEDPLADPARWNDGPIFKGLKAPAGWKGYVDGNVDGVFLDDGDWLAMI